MRSIFRPIVFGIAIGALFFFVPFIFPVFFFILFFGFLFRFFFWHNWRSYGYHKHYYNTSPEEEDIVPIDNQWYKPTIERKGPERQFRVK